MMQRHNHVLAPFERSARIFVRNRHSRGAPSLRGPLHTVGPREYARPGPHEQVERDAESGRLVPLLRRPVVAQALCPIGTWDIAARRCSTRVIRYRFSCPAGLDAPAPRLPWEGW